MIGVGCLTNACVDGSGGAAARAVDQRQLTRRLPLAQQRHRTIRAAVVDDDDLERPAVALSEHGIERESQHASAVEDGYDERLRRPECSSRELPVVSDGGATDRRIHALQLIAHGVGAEQRTNPDARRRGAIAPLAGDCSRLTRSRRLSVDGAPGGHDQPAAHPADDLATAAVSAHHDRSAGRAAPREAPIRRSRHVTDRPPRLQRRARRVGRCHGVVRCGSRVRRAGVQSPACRLPRRSPCRYRQ